ncbi:hypothetical protein G0U57_013646 [Chelydra serpentina]|uniref:Uncharacterized protein n=1 Tax=Chelydra serpentina TaxID=8475 RepID=A0A8T1S9Y8_CHESE|nr:hypothetical protein G0U57_013646 [Chelydra serpentina]
MQELKTKCRASGCFPARAAISTPSAPLYPQLIKSEREEETAEDIVDFFSAARQPAVPSPSPLPPSHAVPPPDNLQAGSSVLQSQPSPPLQVIPSSSVQDAASSSFLSRGESSAVPREFSASPPSGDGSGVVSDSTGISLDSIANRTRRQLN